MFDMVYRARWWLVWAAAFVLGLLTRPLIHALGG